MKVRGIALVLGDGITTDAIIAGRHCKMAAPGKLAPHALDGTIPAGLPLKGRIIVAGKNFGVGSSREQAPMALKAAGVRAVVAASFGRIFFRNAVNIGLPVMVCAGAASVVKDGANMTVELSGGAVSAGDGRAEQAGERLPPFMMAILEDGGLVPHLKRRFADGKA